MIFVCSHILQPKQRNPLLYCKPGHYVLLTDTEKGEEEIAYLALEIKVDTIDGLRLKLLVSSSTN
jgi:hypothetical protein